jgi:Holliday junction resolvase
MNKLERAVKEVLEQQGFDVLRNGWPDFLCVRGRGLMAVEVKSDYGRISDEQLKIYEALRAANIPVFVVRPNDRPDFRHVQFMINKDSE